MKITYVHYSSNLLHCFQQCIHNLLVNSHSLYSSHPQIIASGCVTTLVINTTLESTLWIVFELSPKHMELCGISAL